MISVDAFRSFAENVKSASAGVADPHPLVQLVKRIKPRDAALVAGGAAAMHGGKRLVDDVRMGEQARQGGYY